VEVQRVSIRTKRWNDPASSDDGLRFLICRYRPRGVPAATAPWNGWVPALAPSKALHAAAYGKTGEPLPFAEYERRFMEEMKSQEFWIAGLAKHVQAGETITLLCSSACTDESRCHRTLVKRLIEQHLLSPSSSPVRRRG
jgi:uncharacterized protein YeaO (DUF488 family)